MPHLAYNRRRSSGRTRLRTLTAAAAVVATLKANADDTSKSPPPEIGQLVLASACGYALKEPELPSRFQARVTAVMAGKIPDRLKEGIDKLDEILSQDDLTPERRKRYETDREEKLADGEKQRPMVLRLQAAIEVKNVRLATAARPVREKFETSSNTRQEPRELPVEYASVDVLCVSKSKLDCAVGDIVQVSRPKDQTLIPDRAYIYGTILGDPTSVAPPVVFLVESCNVQMDRQPASFPSVLAPALTIDPAAAMRLDDVGVRAPEGWVVNSGTGTIAYVQCALVDIDTEGEAAAMFSAIMASKERADHPEHFDDPSIPEGYETRCLIPTIHLNLSPEERQPRWPNPVRMSIRNRPEFTNGQLRVLSIVRRSG